MEPAYWFNFRAEDLEGTQLMLEAFLLEGSARDRELTFGEGLRFGGGGGDDDQFRHLQEPLHQAGPRGC